MKAQIIEKDGKPEFAVISYDEYQHYLELLENEADARAVVEFAENYQAGREFLVPVAIVRRELAGESPVKLWREERKLTQQELAEKAGISKPYLSQIETGKRQGTLETMAAISKALEVPIDVLVE